MKKIFLFAFLALFSIAIRAQIGNPWEQNIYMAYSNDEFLWAKDSTILFPSAYTPSAVTDTSKNIFLYYMQQHDAVSLESLMVSISYDGRNFPNSYPVSVIGSTVNKKINPCAALTSDSKIRLYYIDHDSGKNNVLHSAISTDGINFTNDTIIQIVNNQDKSYNDSASISNPDVFNRRGTWYILFESENKLMRAISTDGIAFIVDSVFLFNDIVSTATFSPCG